MTQPTPEATARHAEAEAIAEVQAYALALREWNLLNVSNWCHCVREVMYSRRYVRLKPHELWQMAVQLHQDTFKEPEPRHPAVPLFTPPPNWDVVEAFRRRRGFGRRKARV